MINRKIIFQLNLYIIALNAQLYQPFQHYFINLDPPFTFILLSHTK